MHTRQMHIQLSRYTTPMEHVKWSNINYFASTHFISFISSIFFYVLVVLCRYSFCICLIHIFALLGWSICRLKEADHSNDTIKSTKWEKSLCFFKIKYPKLTVGCRKLTPLVEKLNILNVQSFVDDELYRSTFNYVEIIRFAIRQMEKNAKSKTANTNI